MQTNGFLLLLDLAILAFLIVDVALRLRRKTFTYAMLHHEDHGHEIVAWNAMASKYGLDAGDARTVSAEGIASGAQVIVLWRPTREAFFEAMRHKQQATVMVYDPTGTDLGIKDGADVHVFASQTSLLWALRVAAAL
jgi:hypothetical protein